MVKKSGFESARTQNFKLTILQTIFYQKHQFMFYNKSSGYFQQATKILYLQITFSGLSQNIICDILRAIYRWYLQLPKASTRMIVISFCIYLKDKMPSHLSSRILQSFSAPIDREFRINVMILTNIIIFQFLSCLPF